jgi:hypothetical protein
VQGWEARYHRYRQGLRGSDCRVVCHLEILDVGLWLVIEFYYWVGCLGLGVKIKDFLLRKKLIFIAEIGFIVYLLGCFHIEINLNISWRRGLGFGVWGLGFGVWGLGFGVWGLGFGVW